MSQNKKVMSIAIEPDLHTSLKEYSRRKGLSVSEYMAILATQGVKVAIDDEPLIVGKSPEEKDILPVLLKIPAELKGNREKLVEWMQHQVTGIVNKLS